MYKFYPKHSVIMMIISAIGFGLAVQSIYYKCIAELGSLYIPIVALIISVGLFLTAWVSVKDWYKHFDSKYDVVKK